MAFTGDIFNERSTLLVTVSFVDEDSVAVVPTTAAYRVDDVRSGTHIVESTSIGSLATSNEVEITSAQMTCLDQRREMEEHRMTVQFTYGSGRVGTADYVFAVRNLPKVDSPDVSPSLSVSLSASASASASRSPSASLSPSTSVSPSA